MEISGDFFNLRNPHVSNASQAVLASRQQIVGSNLDSVGGDVPIPFKAGSLAIGVDTGIGSTGPVDPDFCSANLAKDFLQFPLYGPRLGLPLPSGKAATIVFDGHQNIFHFFVRLFLSWGSSMVL